MLIKHSGFLRQKVVKGWADGIPELKAILDKLIGLMKLNSYQT